jgi:hypothetical protein
MKIFGTEFLYISSGTKWEQVTELECTFVVTPPPGTMSHKVKKRGGGLKRKKEISMHDRETTENINTIEKKESKILLQDQKSCQELHIFCVLKFGDL